MNTQERDPVSKWGISTGKFAHALGHINLRQIEYKLASCVRNSQKKSVVSPPSYPRKRASSRGGFETRPYKNLDLGSR